MSKMFQRIGLKFQLLTFGASTFLIPWVGVQHLETQRTTQSEEKTATQQRELQLQQEIDLLNKQVSIANQQISQKDAALKVAQQQMAALASQKQQEPFRQSSSRSTVPSITKKTTQTVTSTPAPAKKTVARTRAS